MKKNAQFLICISILFIIFSCEKEKATTWSNRSPSYSLSFDRLASTWDEAVPLGNATLGELVWQKGNNVRLSLDRADLWDLRPMANLDFKDYNFDWVLKKWKENDYGKVQQKYDAPYDALPAPSKIPAGALEFDATGLGKIASVTLSLKNALCTVKWKNGTVLTTFVHATEPIGWYRFENLKTDITPVIVAPAYVSTKKSGAESPVTGQDLRRLGYPMGKIITTENTSTYEQHGWKDFKFQIHTKWNKSKNTMEGSWSISSQKKPEEHHKTAEEVVAALGKTTMAASLQSHEKWWQHFWDKSYISVPDTILQNQWYMEMYKLGAAARKGAPPISLQSVWTADNGKLPPWKGDYHHDLNTELSYWPTYSSNHLDLEQGFIDWLSLHKPTFKKYTKEFYGTDGLNVPGVTTLTGEPMGGWVQYSFGPTVSAWLGQHFYLHWRYSMDRQFLKDQAYPWLKDVALHFDELSVIGKDGKRRLPLSSSPEIHNNSRDAWFDEMTNFDLALIRWTYEKAAELATELGKTSEAKKWKNTLTEWPDFAVDETGLMFAPHLPYYKSHRHFSHLMAIHPLGLIDVSHNKREQEIIRKTIANMEEKGSSAWTGYSFSWLGNIKARALDGEGAAKALRIFAENFCLPNSFHVNGDQSGKGYSDFTYRPFTLEGNFAFASGIQEMLIQSHTGTLKIFPAIPKTWKNVEFQKLRAEGAFLVSAKMEEGQVKEVQIIPEKGGELHMENPFSSKNISIRGAIKSNWNGEVLNLTTQPNSTITILNK